MIYDFFIISNPSSTCYSVGVVDVVDVAEVVFNITSTQVVPLLKSASFPSIDSIFICSPLALNQLTSKLLPSRYKVALPRPVVLIFNRPSESMTLPSV